MNAGEAEAAVKARPYPKRTDYEDRLSWQAARRDHVKAIAEIELQFKKWLAKEYAPWLAKETQDLIWAKAWQDGHSHGYHSVEGHYVDLADFAEDVVNQNKER